MNTFVKFIGGAALGAVVGAGVYFVLTSDHDEGIIHDFKALVNEVIEEGKRAAEQRRLELEMELQGKWPTAQPISPPAEMSRSIDGA